MLTATQQANLASVARCAVKAAALTGVPPELTIAQWSVESQWGEHPAGHANYFGIKKAARHKQSVTVITHEYVHGERIQVSAEFADYFDLQASVDDFTWLISCGAPYASAWKAYRASKDLNALIHAVAGAYATSPSYANLITQNAARADVAAAIAQAKSSQ